MTDQHRAKIDMLERAMMELGTELFNVKGWLAKNQESNEQFIKTIRGLKQLLDEKGLINSEDFDAAIDLGKVMESFSAQADHSFHQELEKVKKTGH